MLSETICATPEAPQEREYLPGSAPQAPPASELTGLFVKMQVIRPYLLLSLLLGVRPDNFQFS